MNVYISNQTHRDIKGAQRTEQTISPTLYGRVYSSRMYVCTYVSMYVYTYNIYESKHKWVCTCVRAQSYYCWLKWVALEYMYVFVHMCVCVNHVWRSYARRQVLVQKIFCGGVGPGRILRVARTQPSESSTLPLRRVEGKSISFTPPS